jgi:hypothetical protein
MAESKIVVQVILDNKALQTGSTQTKRVLDDVSKSTSNFQKAVGKTNKALQQNRAQSGLNNAILIELGRTASDAQYGFQGMANNIGRIVELGQEFARTGGGGLRGALGTLGKSILGTGGILIGIQLLISFLPTLQKKFKEMTSESGNLNDATKELTKSYDELTKSIKENNKAQAEQDEDLDDALDKVFKLSERLEKNRKKYGDSAKEIERFNSNNASTLFLLDKRIRQAEELGVKINYLRLNEEGYREELEQQVGTAGTLAKSIEDMKTRLKIDKILGELSPVDIAEREIEIFIATQKALAVEEEVYLNSSEYKELVARRVDAENKARLEVLREEFAEQYRQELELKEVIKRMVAESQDEEVPIFGDAEALDMSLSQYSDFISKYIDRTLEGLNEQEDKALKKLDEFYIDALLTEEEYQKGKTAIQDFYSNKRIQQDEKEKRIKIRAIREKEKMEMAYANTLANLGDFLSLLGEKNKGLAIAGVVAEQAANVAKIISNTMAANAIAKVMSPLTLGQPFIKLNNVSAALGIATSVLSARNAIKQINSGQLSSSITSTSGGGGGSAPSIQAPDFNVVGASGQSQLAQTIAGTEARPVRAFVVGKDVSTQQEMDRNITNTASFG